MLGAMLPPDQGFNANPAANPLTSATATKNGCVSSPVNKRSRVIKIVCHQCAAAPQNFPEGVSSRMVIRLRGRAASDV